MADKNFPTIIKDGTITIRDGAGTPLEYVVVFEDGNFSISDLRQGGQDLQEFEDRGSVYAARKVGRKSKTFTFEAHLLRFKREGSGNTHLPDVVLKQGAWASATSTGAAYSDAHLVEVEFSADRSGLGESTDTSITLKYCSLSQGISEGVPGKISISGTCHAFADDYIEYV
jgi:hypothetical protein